MLGCVVKFLWTSGWAILHDPLPRPLIDRFWANDDAVGQRLGRWIVRRLADETQTTDNNEGMPTQTEVNRVLDDVTDRSQQVCHAPSAQAPLREYDETGAVDGSFSVVRNVVLDRVVFSGLRNARGRDGRTG